MIGIVDYGCGNLKSVENAFLKLGYQVLILDKPELLDQNKEIKGVVLPGVGAFADAMAILTRAGWVYHLQKYVWEGNPFLGICLGMQLIFEIGEEHGRHKGLGFLQGRVVKFPAGLKIPHMGWNSVKILKPNLLCTDVPNDSYFYFVHSYYAEPEDSSCILATSTYGVEFPALVGQGNVWGTQFHPEKSSRWGLTVLNNFGKWAISR
mgnify:CR=1 FL=1